MWVIILTLKQVIMEFFRWTLHCLKKYLSSSHTHKMITERTKAWRNISITLSVNVSTSELKKKKKNPVNVSSLKENVRKSLSLNVPTQYQVNVPTPEFEYKNKRKQNKTKQNLSVNVSPLEKKRSLNPSSERSSTRGNPEERPPHTHTHRRGRNYRP